MMLLLRQGMMKHFLRLTMICRMKESQGRNKAQKPLEEPRVEIATPTSRKNMIKNHPSEQIIESKDKGVMTRSRVNEELCLISQVEPKSVDEAAKDNHLMKAM